MNKKLVTEGVQVGREARENLGVEREGVDGMQKLPRLPALLIGSGLGGYQCGARVWCVTKCMRADVCCCIAVYMDVVGAVAKSDTLLEIVVATIGGANLEASAKCEWQVMLVTRDVAECIVQNTFTSCSRGPVTVCTVVGAGSARAALVSIRPGR